MSKVFYCLLLSILLALTNVTAGCGSAAISGDKQIQQDRSGKTDKLPAMQLTSETKFVPENGITASAVKDLVIKYYKDIKFKSDIKFDIKEYTVKALWENSRVQIFDIRIEAIGIYGIAVVEEGKILEILSGMPVNESFIADIDNDGKYEIYINICLGSGIVSEEILGYNMADGSKYHLSDRMKKDYRLFVQDNTLMANEYAYPHEYGKKKGDSLPVIKDLKITKGKLEVTEPKVGFVIYKLKNKENNNSNLYLGQYEKQKNGGYIDKELNNVEIEEKPILTDRDIEKFNWKTNTFTLTENFLKNHPLEEEDIKQINESKQNIEGSVHLRFYSGSKLLNCVDTDSAVIVVNGKRIYTLGFALPTWSSRYPPKIYLEDAGLNSVRVHSTVDLEGFVKDKRIYDFFKHRHKLV